MGVFKKVCQSLFAGESLEAVGRKAFPCKVTDVFHIGRQIDR